jgi:serine/threonine protein kinase
MHRDIKSANIFLTTENIAKIGDLNVSRVMKQEDMSET